MFILLFRSDYQFPPAFRTIVLIYTLTVVMIQPILALFSLESTRREYILSLYHVKLLVLYHRVEPQLVVQGNDVHVGR